MKDLEIYRIKFFEHEGQIIAGVYSISDDEYKIKMNATDLYSELKEIIEGESK